uniref:Uncharacterized protein n=1 Tax=Crocodylus porosus TaxID=8502 RepID=A0A7M4FIF2_CROPO
AELSSGIHRAWLSLTSIRWRDVCRSAGQGQLPLYCCGTEVSTLGSCSILSPTLTSHCSILGSKEMGMWKNYGLELPSLQMSLESVPVPFFLQSELSSCRSLLQSRDLNSGFPKCERASSSGEILRMAAVGKLQNFPKSRKL